MKSKSLSALCLTLSLILWAASSTHASSPAYYNAGEIILKVQLNVELTAAEGKVTSNNPALQTVLNEIQAKDVNALLPSNSNDAILGRVYTVTLPSGNDVIAAVMKLNTLECVQAAELNYVYRTSAIPTDTSYTNQWGLMKINAASAWDLFTGSNSIIVAVLDSGVDWEHADLAANIWNNTDEIPGNGIDDDLNNYVDDVRGWDFGSYLYGISRIDPEDPEKFITSYTWKPEDNDPGVDVGSEPYDFSSHGTHVAGIIGAAGNNTLAGTNVVGVSWNSIIMPVKANHFVYDYIIQDWVPAFSSVATAKAIHYATNNGARVINMSIGGRGTTMNGLVNNALQYAHSKGVVLCAAAGNHNSIQPEYPASFDNIISVAAVDENDIRASFSNYGTTVDITAPGTNILSCVMNNGYEYGGGTSMACPFVSGAAAMVLGYGEALGKKFTPGQVEYILEHSADNISAENPGYPSWLGAGRLNLSNALILANNIHPMISSILVGPADVLENQPNVNEHSSINLQAVAVYSDGNTENITDKVTWSVRPVRYGSFCSYDAGRFIALQVPENREVTVTASYTINGDTTCGRRNVTILNDPSASPLVITGPDLVNPLSANAYKAQYTDADEQATDVTAKVTWEVTSGAEYANFDPGQAGLLLTRESSAGKFLTLQATYIDESTRRAFMTSTTVSIQSSIQQVAGLYMTAPAELTAGSCTNLSLILLMAGQAQGTDVTAQATWSVSPEGVGSFITPGQFQAGSVSSETAITLTAEYVRNGQTYTAQLSTKVIPAVAMGEMILNSDTIAKEDQTEDQNFFSSLMTCPLAGILTLILLTGSLWLIREN